MDDLQKQLNDIVLEHLPKQMGETLIKRFDELEAIGKEHKELTVTYNNLKIQDEANRKALQKVKEKLSAIETREEKAVKKDRELLEREKLMDKTMLEKELELTKLAKEEQLGLIQTVFRWPVIKKSYAISGGQTTAGYTDSTGVWHDESRPDGTRVGTKTKETE
ncbi:hypothetical protein LCGC14_0246370 [marine sediment metagenome]|uniref:Uncharacterized protein n=1 Tax=marine sediment metagenome TaxID=412755 RepID=A0A0F9WR76_9ZZZZ